MGAGLRATVLVWCAMWCVVAGTERPVCPPDVGSRCVPLPHNKHNNVHVYIVNVLAGLGAEKEGAAARAQSEMVSRRRLARHAPPADADLIPRLSTDSLPPPAPAPMLPTPSKPNALFSSPASDDPLPPVDRDVPDESPKLSDPDESSGLPNPDDPDESSGLPDPDEPPGLPVLRNHFFGTGRRNEYSVTLFPPHTTAFSYEPYTFSTFPPFFKIKIKDPPPTPSFPLYVTPYVPPYVPKHDFMVGRAYIFLVATGIGVTLLVLWWCAAMCKN